MLCNLVFSLHFSFSVEFLLFFHVCSVALKKKKIKILGKEDGEGWGNLGRGGGGIVRGRRREGGMQHEILPTCDRFYPSRILNGPRKK